MPKNNRKPTRKAVTVSLLISDILRVKKRAEELSTTSAAILAQAIAMYFELNPEK